MKASLFSLVAAAGLFASSVSFAATPPVAGPFDRNRDDHGQNDRYNDRNSKDFNYGYDKKHRVTAQERARWEAAHRNDRDDRYDRDDRNQNYGYERDHRVTSAEKARWEAQQRQAQIRENQQREAQQRAQREEQLRLARLREAQQRQAQWDAAHRGRR